MSDEELAGYKAAALKAFALGVIIIGLAAWLGGRQLVRLIR